MKHEMKLNEKPFDAILHNIKTIEIRLNDEKRRRISIGDFIEFSKINAVEDKMIVQVVELMQFNSFLELLEVFDITKLGFKGFTTEEILVEMYKIYSKENENKYGILGIRIKKVT